MERSFETETPILWYGPRAHANPGGRNDRAWILWPAWAFRVVAPEFQRRRVNILQKAILSVLRATRLSAMELGQRLGIHHELAAFVVMELQTQGRVAEDWSVTPLGRETLEEEGEGASNLVPGWVFQDPWSGSLWPFVARSLEYARTEKGDNGYPLLDLGSTGRPWRQRVWMQFPPNDSSPNTPGPREILRAALRHTRLVRRAQRLTVWQEEDGDAVTVERLDLNRIASIEERPYPVFLVTYAYVPRNGVDAETDWHACDFFGRGSSPSLRRSIVRVARENEHLAALLDRLLGRTLYGGFDEFRKAAAARKRRARSLIERALTLDIQHHTVAEPLTEVLEAWLEVRDLEDMASPRKYRDVLTACRRTFEHLFCEIASSWPLTGVAHRLCNDREINAATVRGATAALGFTDVPQALFRITRRQVRAVSDYDDSWRLRPLVVATILRAREEARHPLRKAAGKAPDILARIERVADHGGKAAHRSETETIGTAVLDDCVEDTVNVVGLLLDLPTRSLLEVYRDG